MPASESQIKATMKYAKEKLKRIPLDVKKEKYEEYEKFAESKGMSVRGFIISAIEEKIAREEECLITNHTALDNLLLGEYLKKNPREIREREEHYSERITEGYARIKKEIGKYFLNE